MTDLEARLRRYINRGMYRIPGWLHPVDASLFAATLTYQRSREWRGDVAEIGVYHGRSFCLAGQTLADGEAAVAADLFAEPDQLRRFTGHARRNGIDPRILIGPSDRLTSAELPTPVRFFSVDGGHMYGDVKHDAQLAASALAPHGVIAFDDVMSPEWPETTVAVIDWLRSTRSRYAPFAISQGKLYGVPRRSPPGLSRRDRQFRVDGAVPLEGDHAVWHVADVVPPTDRQAHRGPSARQDVALLSERNERDWWLTLQVLIDTARESHRWEQVPFRSITSVTKRGCRNSVRHSPATPPGSGPSAPALAAPLRKPASEIR